MSSGAIFAKFENAFMQFCKEHDLPCKDFIFRVSNDQEFQSCVENALKQKADAFFCADEGMGQKVYFFLHKYGLRIPDDISVLGLETRNEGKYMIPPMTALRQDYKRLAFESVKILQKLICGEKISVNLIIPYQFEERESVRKKVDRVSIPE